MKNIRLIICLLALIMPVGCGVSGRDDSVNAMWDGSAATDDISVKGKTGDNDTADSDPGKDGDNDITTSDRSEASDNDKPLNIGDTVVAAVLLQGGTGRAGVESPAVISRADNGSFKALIRFNSPNYDYMLVGGERIEPVNDEGNSEFSVPLTDFGEKEFRAAAKGDDFSYELEVVADTTAMSTPHEVEYRLVFSGAGDEAAGAYDAAHRGDEVAPSEGGEAQTKSDEAPGEGGAQADSAGALAEDGAQAQRGANISELSPELSGSVVSRMELKYADQYAVYELEDGCRLLRIAGGEDIILTRRNRKVDIHKNNGYVTVDIPVNSVYLAASSAMDLFRELSGLDAITAVSTRASDYDIEEAAHRIESGDMSYVGKYSAPDYELLIERGSSLAIESTMIYHSPKVMDSLKALGIPVMVERSSYESEPMGRLEWIKLYGVLLDKEEEATSFFDEQERKALGRVESRGDKVLFFYISSNGYVNVRKPGDYIAKMIESAGGIYIPGQKELAGSGGMSTANLSWEDFYTYGMEADILIYNGTIDGGIDSIRALIDKNKLFSDFKAVKEGRVYCTNNNMFQETSRMGDIMAELRSLISGDDEGLKYIRKVG